MDDMNIEFMPIGDEIKVFKDDVRRVLSIAVIETFGNKEDCKVSEDVISDADIDSVLSQPMEEIYFVYIDNIRVGAVALNVSIKNNVSEFKNPSNYLRGILDFFIIYPEHHGKGYGTRIIKAIEERYPSVRLWELITPYFEKRNINFYVNKCGYKIVEFFNEYHKDNTYWENREKMRPFESEYFRFEKTL